MKPALYDYLFNPRRREGHRYDRPSLVPRKQAEPVAKGHCRKCGKHIGRGVRFHEKACKGNS